MDYPNKLKIVNDPVYGFITIPNPLIFNLIEHRYFQRLRRISQMGMSYLVYPGAHHTRFHHALGALHLMQQAVDLLRRKGVSISDQEATGLFAAILLHDIGHGPFSHAMEHSIVQGLDHEQLSAQFMQSLNKEFGGQLDLALEIFDDVYPRKFFRQLVSGQLDMDRLDYLRRDSFYTGVAEGTISSERLIAMLNVHDDELVIEEKGIYSVEKFVIARRLMYWQVYLHKTGLVAEQLLVKLLKRARVLAQQGQVLDASKSLNYFLNRKKGVLSTGELELFALLDDYDVISAMKAWTNSDDFVLKKLSKMILNRDLLKIKLGNKQFDQRKLNKKKEQVMKHYKISGEEASYFVFDGHISNRAYDTRGETINLLLKNGEITDVAEASDQLNIKALSEVVTKYFICYPKLE